MKQWYQRRVRGNLKQLLLFFVLLPQHHPSLHMGSTTQIVDLSSLPTTADGKPIIPPISLNSNCPYSILKRNAIVKGVLGLGLVLFEDCYYCFADEEAMDEFISNPKQILDGVLDKVNNEVGLMDRIMGVEQSEVQDETISETSSSKCDGGTQTDTHPVPAYKDPTYTWNEWEMRRKAVKLIDLRNKATHSTQTTKSNFRRDAQTQIYVPKANETQTGINKGTSVPKKVNYVGGIRGDPQKTKKLNVVKLELDL
eukprot:TRINITY_DN491_c0_g2_i1.p1 TRINITY_DN491_c0_g2~~TRINITY_DN491_c0_g2_i1.p1  ORF type:complete len:254 (-),score=69.60 TRINITY_DN491_c0_g2_i1:211-972(-)